MHTYIIGEVGQNHNGSVDLAKLLIEMLARPVVEDDFRLDLPRLDAEMLGALFMHYMLETILTARLLNVDPFDQPAVDEGKQLARDYLAAAQRR